MYRRDLAHVHHLGFSEFAQSAAPGVIAVLKEHDVRRVVEIGCGSGVLARELTDAGFDVAGFDASPAMIALARETAPRARFAVGRFADIALPECDAIVAMGEVLNYGTWAEVRALVERAAARVLLFDVAERGAYPPYDERRIDGDDWSVIAVKESDGTRLRRRVLTFVAGDETMRRDEELHELVLYDRAEITDLLRAHGFRVTRRRSYGTRRLPKGHALYCGVRER